MYASTNETTSVLPYTRILSSKKTNNLLCIYRYVSANDWIKVLMRVPEKEFF